MAALLIAMSVMAILLTVALPTWRQTIQREKEEELIFRGYLQKQFHAASGNALVGIIAQALLFGAGHGYQGVKSMLVIGVFGALFGALAFWRRSLRPGMIAHAWQDFLAGLLLGAYAGTR